ncbi:tabersonine-19-hydroxy-O-acetyltransferase-like [Coffea arabica]|uniref:Tabersonine-19-hydroxy-O-acetyltransferase-like n=1 Tax=Coffea arabica TaxID=13443 RepID=A0A6P6T0Z6_COFAR|nr:vinorine synthase-like [Coffea arabica]
MKFHCERVLQKVQTFPILQTTSTAHADIQLSDILRMPESDLTNWLFAFNPSNLEILSQRYMLMVQVSIFDCGGIAIGLNASYKIFDGMSMSTFMNVWAAITSKSSEQIRPIFISSSLFPPISNFSEEASFLVPNSQMNTCVNYAMKRFVFDSSALYPLKAKAASSSSRKPSSVKVVTGLL